MRLKLFAGRSSIELGKKIAQHLKLPLGKIEIKNHADGETWIKYKENIRGRDVYLIQSTYQPDSNLMELLIMIDGAKRASAKSVNVVMPYFGYARQDRKDQPRVSITAKLVANLITTAGADRVITIDLHASQIQGFFDIPVDNLYGSKIFEKIFPQLKKLKNLSVASTDVGGIKQARAYAKILNAKLILIDKRRPQQDKSEVMNIIGQVSDRNIIIVDDVIDTGNSLCNASSVLKKRNALSVRAIATHAVFAKQALKLINNNVLDQVFVSDSIPITQKVSKKIIVISAARMLANAIRSNHLNRSISNQFLENKN